MKTKNFIAYFKVWSSWNTPSSSFSSSHYWGAHQAFHHSGEEILMNIFIFYPYCLFTFNYTRGVFAVWGIEVELAHSNALLKSADHQKSLLSTLKTNMQTLNRLLHFPWTNIAAVWKHTTAVSDPWETEVQDAFSFDFSAHLRQVVLKCPLCSAVTTQRLITFFLSKNIWRIS